MRSDVNFWSEIAVVPQVLIETHGTDPNWRFLLIVFSRNGFLCQKDPGYDCRKGFSRLEFCNKTRISVFLVCYPFFTSLCRSKAVICRSPSNSTFYARKVCCPLVKIVNLPFVDWFGWDIWQNTWFVVLREIKLKTESENPAQMSCSVLLWETSIPLEPSGASFLQTPFFFFF